VHHVCYCIAKIGEWIIEKEEREDEDDDDDDGNDDDDKEQDKEQDKDKEKKNPLVKETKRCYTLFPKTNDNINFIMDYIRFLAKRSKNKSKVVTVLLQALEEDPYNYVLLSAFSDEFLSICDSRIEVLFQRTLTYHKESHIQLLYADYIQNIVKDSDRAYLYYKAALDGIEDVVLQENIKKSSVLVRMAHLFEVYYQDYNAASEAYIKSIELDDCNIAAYFFYASFLARIEQDFPKARLNYLTALILFPDEKILHPFVEFLRETDKNPVMAIAVETWMIPPWDMYTELKVKTS